MACTIKDLLNDLKLSDYLINFEVNNVHNVVTINDELLQRVGVEKIGHRKRILNELEKFRTPTENTNDLIDINSSLDDIDDEPPPALPPKSKAKSVKSPDRPTPPARTTSTKEVTKHTEATVPSFRPVKPPRRNIRGGSLPPGFRERLTASDTANYKLMAVGMDLPVPAEPTVSPLSMPPPPLPPPSIPLREDLNEEGQKSESVVTTPTENMIPNIVPKRQAPPIPSHAASQKKSIGSDVTDGKFTERPIKPMRPSRKGELAVSTKDKLDLDTQTNQNACKEIQATDPDEQPDNTTPVASSDMTRRFSRTEPVKKRRFSSKSDVDISLDDDCQSPKKILDTAKTPDDYTLLHDDAFFKSEKPRHDGM